MTRGLIWTDLRLHETLGEGQSGTVFRATLTRPWGALPTDAVVAVKRYKPWVLHEPGQIERIFAEIETGRRVEHPNVMRVLGAVADSDGRPALVMAYYEGQTLETILTNQRRSRDMYSAAESFVILRGIAAGIVALHEHGVTHRDIKPANVIITTTGPVIADFGVIQSDHLPEQTTTGKFLGTILYAAPEYLFGNAYDKRIDLYSFGAIGYELFTSRRSYSEFRHWAQIIAARAQKESAIARADLDHVTALHGWHVADLVACMLRATRCQLGARKLDLKSFIHAVDAEIWKTDFVSKDGHISCGEQVFEGIIPTARKAAEIIGKFQRADIDVLIGMLRANYWSEWISTAGLRPKQRDMFLAAHVADARSKWTFIRIAPAVKRAFALGLFS